MPATEWALSSSLVAVFPHWSSQQFTEVRVRKALSQMNQQAQRGELVVQGHVVIAAQVCLKFRLFPLRDAAHRIKENKHLFKLQNPTMAQNFHTC